MKLNFAHERILAVVAHPDDAELLCAGTLARAKSEGATVGIGVLCRGDKGQPQRALKNLVAIRRKEMQAAARLLGATLFVAGFSDGELADGRETRLRVVEIFRQFRPTLVLAHSAIDYHTDHRVASGLAETASWACASPGYKTKSPALAAAPALWWMDTIQMHQFAPGFLVDVSAQVEVKEKMLGCHRSQLQRGGDGNFSPLLELMRQQYGARGAQAGVAAAEAFQIHAAFKRTRAW